MSGGGLSDWDDNSRLYIMDDWIRHVRQENPLLADMMVDLKKLLEAYDYYMAGDSGAERVEKAWTKFSEKWLSKDLERLKPLVMERCRDLINSVISGHMGDR